jgi:hypothetical protein
MNTALSTVAREISHWRHFFRTRDAALARAEPGQSSHGLPRDEAPTEWAETEWPDTCPAALEWTPSENSA